MYQIAKYKNKTFSFTSKQHWNVKKTDGHFSYMYLQQLMNSHKSICNFV